VKSIFTENLGLKVSALLIAVFLWFFVTSQGQSEISLEVPVELKNIPSELGVQSISSKTVTLTVRGQERFMKNLSASDIRVFLDLGRAAQGESLYPVNKDDVRLPFAMTVMTVSPASLKIRLEEIMSKTVRVQAQLLGAPEGGVISTVLIEPKVVLIKGLKSDIRKVNSLKTEPFDVTGINRTVTEELDLDISGLNIKAEATRVKVKILLTEGKK
jgi:YbbR domain-containing protein